MPVQLQWDFEPTVEDKRIKGYTCPCCNQFVKLYKRTFNCNMALAAIHLYHNREKGFIHLEKSLQKAGLQRCGDASYLRHYRLIEASPEQRRDGSNRNGFYKITGAGILFVEMKFKVPKHFLTFNNKCENFEGESIGILEALGEKFNYSELMQNN